ncbi:MAG: hypothetical protein ACE5Z5_11005 [Candidatus Bathyarchaeia archaeon]
MRILRLTKLKKKILLALLEGRAFSPESLATLIYPEKRITLRDRIRRAAKALAEIREKEGPEAARIYQMLFIDGMNRRKKDVWMPNAATTAVRRALESLREEGLIVKDEFWEERGEFHRYGHWRPSLTEKGEKLAKEVKREILKYFEEWAHLIS